MNSRKIKFYHTYWIFLDSNKKSIFWTHQIKHQFSGRDREKSICWASGTSFGMFVSLWCQLVSSGVWISVGKRIRLQRASTTFMFYVCVFYEFHKGSEKYFIYKNHKFYQNESHPKLFQKEIFHKPFRCFNLQYLSKILKSLTKFRCIIN